MELLNVHQITILPDSVYIIPTKNNINLCLLPKFETFNRRIKIYNLNANHWETNKYTIREAIRQENPDIVLLQDHGKRNDDRITIWNYNILQQNQANEVHDGTLIAVRKDITFIEMDTFSEEMLAINVPTPRGMLTIATAYQPPRRPHLLREDFTKLFRRQNPVFLLGDLNARCRNSGYNRDCCNQQGRHLSNFIEEGLCQRLGPDFPTFITNRARSKPDIILSNNAGLPNYWIRPGLPTSSDHQTILMDICWSPIQVPSKPRKQYNRTNWQNYQDQISQQTSDINLQNGDNTDDIEEALYTIQRAIQQADSDHIPTSTFRTLSYPSYTQAEKNMIEQLKGYYHRLSNRIATPLDWTQLKRTRYFLNAACKRNSKQLWDNKIENIQFTTEPKKFWNQIKTINESKTNTPKFIQDNNGNKIYIPAEQEPIFRQFWREIYKENRTEEQLNKARNTIIEVEANLQEIDLRPINTIDLERIQDLKITTEEVKHTLNTFSQKAPGWDGITKIHLSKALESIKNPITKCFNAALSCGYFPTLYKHTKLIFIPKPGKPATNVANYRPISLFSSSGKLLEKLLIRSLSGHLQEHHQYNLNQHGFRSQRGTETALAMMWEAIAQGRKHKLHVCVTSRDIEKAFDRVWQRGLIFKLSQLNLHPNLTKILSHYLKNRTASIQIDDYIGPKLPIECGVPQGGCLSTTLFNIYTGDIPDKVYPWTQNTLYADDVTQIVRGTTHGEIKHVWSTETSSINRFEDHWMIKANMGNF